MATLQSPTTPANQQEVTSKKSALVSIQARGQQYSVVGTTGTIAAALAANSPIFAMRFDPGAGTKKAFITRIKIEYITIVAFTVPITAGRALSVYRGAGAACAGGTSIPTIAKKKATDGLSECELAQGGDVRVSATATLTVVGVTFEADQLARMGLVGMGAAGATKTEIFDFDETSGGPVVLAPGELIAIRNPAAMDAGGTWQAIVTVDFYEEDSITY